MISDLEKKDLLNSPKKTIKKENFTNLIESKRNGNKKNTVIRNKKKLKKKYLNHKSQQIFQQADKYLGLKFRHSTNFRGTIYLTINTTINLQKT